ncbi:MAG: hypothetical protein IPL99_08680 [Candidatus Competibacteraceae bacterium]|nr:hypothetical protein [Candidatus Competibacteraceae bacterium]
MPINPDFRHLYPPHWRELANQIKFERAGGRCERCGRPHGQVVLVIKDGGWLDPETGEGYDDQGQSLGLCQSSDEPEGRLVKTILTCAHLDQNPAHNDPTNLAALCPRCHLRHDQRQHIQSAYRNRRKNWAIKDLFDGSGTGRSQTGE